MREIMRRFDREKYPLDNETYLRSIIQRCLRSSALPRGEHLNQTPAMLAPKIGGTGHSP